MKPFNFVYTNHRGETTERTAIPISVRWGSTQWHPEPQWLMLAVDMDKGALREFAMADISETSTRYYMEGAGDAMGQAYQIIGNLMPVEGFGPPTTTEINRLMDYLSKTQYQADFLPWPKERDPVAAADGNAEKAAASAAQWEEEARYFLDHCPWTVRHCEGGGPEDLHGSLAITLTKMQGLLKDVAKAVKMLDAAREAAREYVGPGEVNALRDLEKAARACLSRGNIPVNHEPIEPAPAAPPQNFGGMSVELLRLRFFRDLTDAERIAAFERGSLGEEAKDATQHGTQALIFNRMLGLGEAQILVDALNRKATAYNKGAPE